MDSPMYRISGPSWTKGGRTDMAQRFWMGLSLSPPPFPLPWIFYDTMQLAILLFWLDPLQIVVIGTSEHRWVMSDLIKDGLLIE